jgi:hypothetical protein
MPTHLFLRWLAERLVNVYGEDPHVDFVLKLETIAHEEELLVTVAAQNTDKELWRATPGDAYAPSIHVTASGSIGINVAGSVVVMPIEKWHALAWKLRDPSERLPKTEDQGVLLRTLESGDHFRHVTNDEQAKRRVHKVLSARSPYGVATQPVDEEAITRWLAADTRVIKIPREVAEATLATTLGYQIRQIFEMETGITGGTFHSKLKKLVELAQHDPR